MDGGMMDGGIDGLLLLAWSDSQGSFIKHVRFYFYGVRKVAIYT
jgi:hypothetical protein